MRQFLFAVVLVAAAFAGGAMVNGPGVRWVQARLLDYMGLKDGGEIASIDPPRVAEEGNDPRRPGPGPDAGASATPAAGEPATGPAVKGGAAPKARGGKDQRAEPSPPPLPIPATVPEPAAPRAADRAESRKSARSATAQEDADAPPAPLDPDIGVALLASRSPAGSAPPEARKEEPRPRPIALEVAPSSVRPASAPSASPSQAAAAAGTVEDWRGLRGRLQALGVSRYSIEGQPGGRVVFSCLIPLAGRQAVAQRFEAEGDDEIQAARAAIRRIALWRAARPAAEPSP
jgi:hypothetical protein